MKKIIYLFATTITMLFVLNACKSSTQDTDKTLKFSTLTVEEQKKAIEQNGLDLADKITLMQQTKGYVALTQFLSYNGSSAPAALMVPLRKLQQELKQKNIKAVENFNNQMRSAANVGDDIWGTWTWNASTKQFDKASGVIKNQAVIKFPAEDLNSTINNAILTVIYSESNVLVPHSDPSEFYPKSISAILKINDTEAINAQYSGEFESDGTPKSILQTLVIGAFNWTASLSNTNTDATASYLFKYNTEVLMKYEVNAKGNFTVTQIDAIDNDNTGTLGPENFISSGNVTFQLMNIAFYGGITDLKNFLAEQKTLKADTVWHTYDGGKYYSVTYPKSYFDNEVVIFNKYLKLYGFFATENQKFADVEFFTNEGVGIDYSKPATVVYTYKTSGFGTFPTCPYKYDYYGTDYVYNNNTNTYDITYTFYAYPTIPVYNLQPRLVLSDGSKVTDFDAYVHDNFETVITKFRNLFN